VEPDTLTSPLQSGEDSDTLMAVQELKRQGRPGHGGRDRGGSAIGASAARTSLHAGPEVAVAVTPRRSPTCGQLAARAAAPAGSEKLSAPTAAHVGGCGTSGIMVSGRSSTPKRDRHGRHPLRRLARSHSHRPGPRRCRWQGKARRSSRRFLRAREPTRRGDSRTGRSRSSSPRCPAWAPPSEDLIAKNISTIEQIKARGGPVIALDEARTSPTGSRPRSGAARRAGARADPFNAAAGLRYHAAAKWAATATSRNLAKSVTVE